MVEIVGGAGPAQAERAGRHPGLDRLRGLAVVMMVLDHALIHVPSGLPVRLTVTRVALPLFCVVAGTLAQRSGRLRRPAVVAIVGVAVMPVEAAAGIGVPGPLFLVGLVVLAVRLAGGRWRRVWPVVAAVAVLQPVTWPTGATGYQLGTVVALVVIGTLLDAQRVGRLGERLPGVFALAGRWPVTIYAMHVAALAAIAG